MQPDPIILENTPGFKFSLDATKLPRDAWRPSEASNQRRSPRTAEREIERIPAWIRSRKDTAWERVRLWDFSMNGFGVLYDSNSGHSAFSSPGGHVELKLGGFRGSLPQRRRETVIPCRIENACRLEKGMRIGLSRRDLSGIREDGTRRFPGGHLIDSVSPLTARIRNPFLYNEWADAKLIGIGMGPVFVFESSDPALLLMPGEGMNVDMELPLDSKGTFSGTMGWVQDGKFGSTVFALQETDISFELSNAIGEHFIEAGICKPSELPEYGVGIKRFKDQFHFRYVATQEDYRTLLELRHQAYRDAGKVPADATVESVEDVLDSRSRLLAAFHGETVVASVALTFGMEGLPFRSETVCPGGVYPIKIPPKDTIIEVRSLCTDVDYRGGDLIQGMFEHIARTAIFSDREWLLTFATPKLWPLYKRIGFRKTGVCIPLAILGGLEHHLILMHRDTLIHGKGMTPLAWNYFFGDMVRDLISKGHLRPGFVQGRKIALLSLFQGVTRKWLKTELERQFKTLLQRTAIKGTKDD